MHSERKKDVNVKVFNMLTRINESKTFVKHLNVKNMVPARKIIIWILTHLFVRIIDIGKVLLMIQYSCVMKLNASRKVYQQMRQVPYHQMSRVLF